MGKWEFNKADLSSVWSDPKQGDHFNNDDIGLCEALVREVIQNSTDAGNGSGPVKVRFNTTNLQGQDAVKMRALLQPLEPNLSACHVDISPLQGKADIPVLSIEDFNTCGLTGSFTERDGDNFSSFWRDLSISKKSGNKGGRWGLGKLVFSSSSLIKTFFGLTKRSGDEHCALMGQSVLNHHDVGDDSYEPHGFWFADRHDNRLQLPVTNDECIDEFSAITKIARTSQSGLSILIPFYNQERINYENILDSVIKNYYFPILAGKLVVEVEVLTVNSGNFLEIVADSCLTNIPSNIPFKFIKKISDALDREPDFTAVKEIGKYELSEGHFAEGIIESMKEKFSGGGLFKTRIPVLLKRKSKGDVRSFIDLYIQDLPEGKQSFALFSRGAIILPGERGQFRTSAAYGALVASDSEMEEFLGDSENPAHTRWNARSEKLAKN